MPNNDENDRGFRWLEADVSDVLFLVRRHLWLLLAAPAVGFGLALLASLLVRPQFTTHALVFLRPNFDKDIQVERVYSKLEDDDSLRSMERAIISDTVILRTIERLGLRDDEDFLGEEALEKGPLTDAKLLKLVRDRYRTKLVPTTRLVELEVDDYSAERAVEVANALIEEFLGHLTSDRIEKETELRVALTAQVQKSLAATLELERKLEAFRTERPGQFVEQDSEIFHERLLQQGTALNEANSEVARLAGTVKALQSIDPDKDPYRVFQILSNRNSEYLSNLLSMLAAAKAELAAVRKRSTERAPDYRAAVSRLEEVESTMRGYAAEMKNGIESEYRAALEKVAKLDDSLAGLQSDFVDFKSTSAEFRGIKGEIDRNWNTFSKLQQSIMDLDLEPETMPTFVTVMSEPVVPDKKSKPFRLLWVVIGTILGGGFAVGVIFLRNRFGLPFTSREQLEQRFEELPVAALKVPDVGSIAEIGAQLDSAPELLNVLVSLRGAKLVHIASAEPPPGAEQESSASLSVIPEIIGRMCGRHRMETLWINFDDQVEAVPQIRPAGSARLSKLTVSAERILDEKRFEEGLQKLSDRFDKVIVDTTCLAGSEARLAIAGLVISNVLLVDGERCPRSKYERLVTRLRDPRNGELSLVYVTRSNGSETPAGATADHHQVNPVNPVADEPTPVSVG